MRVNRTIGLFTKMVLVVSLLFSVVTFAGTTAQAQGWPHRGGVIVWPRVFISPRPFFPRTFYPRSYFYNPGYYYPSSRVTEDQGFHDGRDDGRDDAKHDKGYDPYRHGDYKNAITSAYIEGYLRGYAQGYRERIG
jgi:hypothetical protein